jgi:hypothetical protein
VAVEHALAEAGEAGLSPNAINSPSSAKPRGKLANSGRCGVISDLCRLRTRRRPTVETKQRNPSHFSS